MLEIPMFIQGLGVTEVPLDLWEVLPGPSQVVLSGVLSGARKCFVAIIERFAAPHRAWPRVRRQ